MRKLCTRLVVGVVILLACCACAFALDPSLDISQYAHTSWRDRDGFAKGFVLSIAQTPDGYLWLGTEFGLLRFLLRGMALSGLGRTRDSSVGNMRS